MNLVQTLIQQNNTLNQKVDYLTQEVCSLKGTIRPVQPTSYPTPLSSTNPLSVSNVANPTLQSHQHRHLRATPSSPTYAATSHSPTFTPSPTFPTLQHHPLELRGAHSPNNPFAPPAPTGQALSLSSFPH